MIPKDVIDNWIVILNERKYAGSRKDQIDAEYNQRFENGHWYKAWLIDGKIEEQGKAIELYEDAYFYFLKDSNGILEWLINKASEVYDINPSNVNSGLDYTVQECMATHLQDIAVRHVLKRLNKEFQGDHLVQIRGHESEGYILNPGQVPFHKPELILPSEDKEKWWKPDSVEAFYQHNKVLVVDPDKLIVKPEIECPNGTIIYKYDKQTYYQPLDNPLFLRKIKGNIARRHLHEKKGYKKIDDQIPSSYSTFLNK